MTDKAYDDGFPLFLMQDHLDYWKEGPYAHPLVFLMRWRTGGDRIILVLLLDNHIVIFCPLLG